MLALIDLRLPVASLRRLVEALFVVRLLRAEVVEIPRSARRLDVDQPPLDHAEMARLRRERRARRPRQLRV